MTDRHQSRPMYEYMVLDTVQATAADVSTANQAISLGDPLEFICNFPELRPGVSYRQAAVAGTAQVDTLTPTAPAADLQYDVKVQWYDFTSQSQREAFFSYVATAADTATTVCDAFRSQINTNPTVPIVATGTTTLVMTADVATFPVQYTFVSTGVNNMTVALTTPGVMPENTIPVLSTLEGLSASNFTTGNTYTRYRFTFDRLGTSANTQRVTNERIFDLFVDDGAGANYTALDGRLTEILGALNAGGTAVDPELLAVD